MCMPALQSRPPARRLRYICIYIHYVLLYNSIRARIYAQVLLVCVVFVSEILINNS